jgi:3-hydroxyisobutyrate dehydrogenase
MTRIGFIGLGAMGAPMARNVAAAGFELAVFDVDEERARATAEAAGARAATSAVDAAADADAIVLMVTNAAQARDALLGDDGAAAALPAQADVILMSTIGPQAVADLAEGLSLLDAPCSGGVARAESGDLLVMAGGPSELFQRARPILDAVAARIVHCGENPGDGQAVKMVNQLLCGVHIAAAAEALAYAQALGLDAAMVHETIRHGAAASFMLDDRGPRMLAGEFEEVSSALDIFVKDMGLVVDAGADHGARTPLAQTARELYEEGAAQGLGREDDSGVIRLLEGGQPLTSS